VPAIDFGHDLEAMREAINSNTKLVFVANPNNPTGTYVGENQIEAFLSDLPDHVITVLDEAYFEYVRPLGVNDYPDGVSLLTRYPNLIVTRTFSKAYGLAALRVGYAIATPEITEILNRVRPPFNVNAMGLAAAEAALSDSDFISQCVTENAEQLLQMNQAFVDLGLSTIPSVANFICVQVGAHASKIYELMLAQGVIVRPIGNYGLPEHLRITVGLPSENQKAISSLSKTISHLADA
jgi:histidinol-phosphate aminotransferase